MNIYKLEQKQLVPYTPEEIFPFLREKGHIVSLVGAGGKTTLLYSFAQISADRGFRTLVTTTTHILEPQNGCYARSEAEIDQLWAEQKPAVVGTQTMTGKLKSLAPELLAVYCKKADLVLIEADGAKRKPCKAPRSHEPVLLPECDTVLGVFGLKSIGQTLESACFGLEEAKQLLGITDAEHLITPMDGVTLLSSFSGARKNVGNRSYYAVVNQCDIAHGIEYGMEMLEALEEKGISSSLSGK